LGSDLEYRKQNSARIFLENAWGSNLHYSSIIPFDFRFPDSLFLPLRRQVTNSFLTTDGLGAAFGRNQIRNTKQFQMTKNSMLKTLRKPHLINGLLLCILKNEHKKQEVDG
jgi:hypothetical protein